LKTEFFSVMTIKIETSNCRGCRAPRLPTFRGQG
jgi:hypothetical protein